MLPGIYKSVAKLRGFRILIYYNVRIRELILVT